MIKRIWTFGTLLGVLSLPLQTAHASEAALVPSADAARRVVVSDLTVNEASVSGTVVNRTAATVRGVDLMLRQVWHWNDERHPGTDSPGRALPFTLAGDVAPNASAPFTFPIAPLEQRSDGRFVSTMDVTGFSEVGP